jgi:hypothetical protein
MLQFRQEESQQPGASLENGRSSRTTQTSIVRDARVAVWAMTAEPTLWRASHESTGTDRDVLAGCTGSVWLWIARTFGYFHAEAASCP